MPHIHLETTADLPENADVPDILDALTACFSNFESISSASIMAYHSLRSVWTMGEGSPPGFAHCTVAILSGRSESLRREIADGMYHVLTDCFPQSREAGEISITLELREMDPATYRK